MSSLCPIALPLQLPPNAHPESRWWLSQKPREMQFELQATGFSLAQPYLLQAFGKQASRWKICLISLCLSNKVKINKNFFKDSLLKWKTCTTKHTLGPSFAMPLMCLGSDDRGGLTERPSPVRGITAGSRAGWGLRQAGNWLMKCWTSMMRTCNGESWLNSETILC